MTATRPDVRPSNKIVNVEFTNTLPSRMLQRRKFPWSLTGWIFAAYFRSFTSPVFLRIYEQIPRCYLFWISHSMNMVKFSKTFYTFNSVLSNDIRPKLRPEKRAEKHKQQRIMMIANHRGTIKSPAFSESHVSVPWCMNGNARSIF